jgi:ketosteroid isomerase-like protein
MAEPGLVHRGDDDEYAEERHASAGKIFGILLVVFVLVGAAQVGWEYRAPVKQRVTDMRTNLGAKLTAAEGRSIGRAGAPSASTAPAANTAQAASTAPAASQPDPAELAKAPQAAKLAESDPKAWLANWAGALAGRDAAAQAAYYADPVDKYFLRRSVARADVLADKQASVAKRSGHWALTLDDVVVAQQTDTTARILLVKHIVSANGAGERREERLPTQIRLKKVGGQWRIVSEQTLG